ncbi:hypothetical protein JG687_00004133 [Phytophthora cactorum]|uniref:Uncharacterized protein n=1 Tax=Phytophthora cactorum TaxID=29920 RepID=A0A8T1UQL9_9STRA|nr:hypothetical protein PC120_g19755 [Phytophthora cactorum]KAG3068636.1 hypothetical protein PC121_g10144 [Phytophthora cactorum]KAG6967701.1 hypothetical protein JG687_00004133 [Phytophthora cactorum]
MVDRSDASYLHPGWTEEETTMLVKTWSAVESSSKNYRPTRNKFGGGLDDHIAAQFSLRSSKNRTPSGIHVQRCKLYDAIRFIHRFDEMQQTCGGTLWFDLSNQERDRVAMTDRATKTSLNLTRKAFNTLVKLKSVRKWTKVRHAVVPKPKAYVEADVCSPEKCHSCWSTFEVKSLVRSWSLFMKKSSSSVTAFVTQSSAESATSYTPWNHSTMSAWRKMMRIATSYLFIRDFNKRYAPAKWFQLSDGVQDMWLDWTTLPSDFEDISKDIYEEIHRVDFPLSSQTVAIGKVSSKALGFNTGSPSKELRESSLIAHNPPRPKLRTESPHLADSNPTHTQEGAKHARDQHKECNDLYEYMEKLQNKQFKQGIQRLRADIERDIREGADAARAVLFDQLGNPGENGDATFVANLLADQQRQLRDRFAQFQRDESVVNQNLFDTSSENLG